MGSKASKAGKPSTDVGGTSGGVSLRVVPGRAAALAGVKNTIRALVQIRTAPLQAAAQRPRVHVACVLDCSGSMRGAKLTNAKRAVRKLVKHLQPHDVLHFITYDNTATVVFCDGDLTIAGKEDLVDQIRGVHTGGATNLMAGLELGVELLRTSAKAGRGGSEAVAPVRRVFLFSDGLVNVGEQDPAVICGAVSQFAAEGVTVSAFGIGSDFDEPLMSAIAEHGKGSYCFLETAETIPKLVSKSVHQLLAVTGTDAKLDIRGRNGAVVTKVFGETEVDSEGGAHVDCPTATAAGVVSLDDLHADNMRQVLIEFEVMGSGTPAHAAKDGAAAGISCTLSYAPPATTGARASTAASEGRRTLDASCSVRLTENRSELGTEQPDVTVAHAVQLAAKQDEAGIALAAKYDIDGAVQIKKASLAGLESALAALGVSPAACKLECYHRLEKAIERARKTLSSLQEKNKPMDSYTMGYAYESKCQRRMSDNGMSSGCDSDGSAWSDEDEGGAGAHGGAGGGGGYRARLFRRGSGGSGPPHRHNSSDASELSELSGSESPGSDIDDSGVSEQFQISCELVHAPPPPYQSHTPLCQTHALP